MQTRVAVNGLKDSRINSRHNRMSFFLRNIFVKNNQEVSVISLIVVFFAAKYLIKIFKEVFVISLIGKLKLC